MLKISAVYLIGNPEIPIHYISWGQVEQALLNSRIHDFTKFCVYNLDAMQSGIRKIVELQESGQKLIKPRIGIAIIKLLEAPLNIGSKSLVGCATKNLGLF